MYRIEVRERRKSCAARTLEERRNAISKIRRAVGMKIAAEDSKTCNIAAVRKRPKTCRRGNGSSDVKSSFYGMDVIA
ncbi:hypothetical protein E2C01_048430 [Portunus trituberculatus]|uniref:Uncharacterized protein n=1 Tax=Portunus trituberculatus TaxID=210409 RepID=A0A5B7G351_PORTR|nr:hypothetical protein [Portunus trituberculatus]